MSGLPEYNFPQFFFWEKYWQKRGFKVINPAKQFFGIKFLPWWFYICYDIFTLCVRRVDIIFLMKDWEISTGACIEALVADKNKIKIIYEIPVLEWENEY